MTTRFELKNLGPGTLKFSTFNGRKKGDSKIIPVGETIGAYTYPGLRFSIEEGKPEKANIPDSSPPAE